MIKWERWKIIEDFPKHKISNYGRVRGAKGNIRKLFLNKDNYYLVQIANSRKDKKTFLVHRLVAQHFCKKGEGKGYVDHINHIKTDNRASNLRWSTAQENNKNRLFLSKVLVKKIIRLHNRGKGINDILIYFGILPEV